MELKQEREIRNIKLEDIADRTKINIDFLKSIEAGNFNFLPDTYVRYFLKSYLQQLGRNIDKYLDRYDDITKPPEHPIITDEDSYDEPVGKILNEIAAGAIETGKVENQDLFKIEDRKAAIKKACQLAQAGDLVLITGKGTEQSIKSNGKVMPWDDRVVTKEVLREI